MCPKCKETIEDQFDTCWKCAGEERRSAAQPQMTEQRHPNQRRRFWMNLVLLGLMCLTILFPACFHRWQAKRTVDLLQPLTASDARFTRIRIWRSGDHAMVAGLVASEADERALRALVHVANPPGEVIFTLETLPGLK